MLFTVRIWGASSYETRRANDTASILVLILVVLHVVHGTITSRL